MPCSHSENLKLSNKYAVLLEEPLRENGMLREQLMERDEDNVHKIQELSSYVSSLCQLIAEKETAINTNKKKGATKVHVPTRCCVSSK